MAEVPLEIAPEPTVVTFPDSPFKLHQPFPPAGDQPTAIEGLVEGIDDGTYGVRVDEGRVGRKRAAEGRARGSQAP